MSHAHSWALVLAAGDGTRVSALTRDAGGMVVPKQFCRCGGTTLLAQALSRAGRLVPPSRTVTVVAARHRAWWRPELEALPASHAVVQPDNRGTAAGVLLPLLSIARRDPRATVVLLPADHLVADEEVFAAASRAALRETARRERVVTLLGITPDHADGDYGWIVPADGRPFGPVARFSEKPGAEAAAALQRSGGLWNSFVLAARASTLLSLYRGRLPALLRTLTEATELEARGRRGAVAAAYATLPIADFSRDLLQGSEAWLRLLAVPPCGWDDLGTPERLARRACRLEPPAPTAARREVPEKAQGPPSGVWTPLSPARGERGWGERGGRPTQSGLGVGVAF
jgi:mannose-1-phosphate guanylyltransferase